MIVLTGAQVVKLTDRARFDGIRLRAGSQPGRYLALSARSGQFDYVVDTLFRGGMMGADCSCPAGERGVPCKHAGAALSAELKHRAAEDAAQAAD